MKIKFNNHITITNILFYYIEQLSRFVQDDKEEQSGINKSNI